MALVDWRRAGSSDRAVLALIIVVFAIGLGSFAFHTLATRGARLLDVIPIGVFIYGYFLLALRRMLGMPWVYAVVLSASKTRPRTRWTARRSTEARCSALTTTGAAGAAADNAAGFTGCVSCRGPMRRFPFATNAATSSALHAATAIDGRFQDSPSMR
jgi:hypothetical protein